MDLRLKRIDIGEDHILGELYVNKEFLCNILEPRLVDVNRNTFFDGDEKKIWGESAIPYGIYKVVVTYSPAFKKRLPLLLDVPHFEGIRIHAGNTLKDTAGCLLPGEVDRNYPKVIRVNNSTPYVNKIISMIDNLPKDEECWIEVI